MRGRAAVGACGLKNSKALAHPWSAPDCGPQCMEMGWRGVLPTSPHCIPTGGLTVKGNNHAVDLFKNDIGKTLLMTWFK